MPCIPKEGKHLSFNIKWALDDFLFRHTQILLLLRSVEWWHGYISSTLHLAHFLKKNLTKLAVIWEKKSQKADLFAPQKLKNHTDEGKGKEKKNEWGGNEKKATVALIVFMMATLEIVFGWKILFDRRGPFGSNVFKNPATHRKYKKGRKLRSWCPW